MIRDTESPADDIGLSSSELWELYETDEPTWLPAPDSKPPELADAQMLTVRDQNGIPMHDIAAAAEIAWGRWEIYYEYRPLYSDSGHALCSPEGLEPWAMFVAADENGTYQFNNRPEPIYTEDEVSWWPENVVTDHMEDAPESHRRPGDWRASLMEVMR